MANWIDYITAKDGRDCRFHEFLNTSEYQKSYFDLKGLFRLIEKDLDFCNFIH